MTTQEPSLDIKQVAANIAAGNYELLLGSGFNVGAHSRNGTAVPNQDELRRIFASFAGVNSGFEHQPLQLLYEDAMAADGRGGPSFSDLMSNTFVGCVPGWQTLICGFPWKRIWTLNVDDVVENAYASCESGSKVYPVTWDEPLVESPETELRTPIIHLHGMASRLDPQHNLVFSVEEYARAVHEKRYWHALFHEVFASRPFLIVGASIKHEVDLATAFRNGSGAEQIWGTPTLLVDPALERLDRERAGRWGIHSVDSEGESFLSKLKDLATDAPVFGSLSQVEASELGQFFNQFEWLTPESSTQAIQDRHDIFSGSEPRWSDATAGKIAQFEIVEPITRNLLSADEQTSLQVIIGRPATGKTCAMFSVALNCISKGFQVYRFREESRLDVEICTRFLKSNERAVLLFDQIGEVAEDLQTLIDSCRDLGVQARILAVDRTSRLDQIRRSIDASLLNGNIHNLGGLSDTDIEALLKVLGKASRLGRLTAVSAEERASHFRSYSKRNLVIGLHELERSTGFETRIAEMIHEISGSEARRLVAAVSAVHALGATADVSLVARAAGATATQVLQMVGADGSLNGILTTDKWRRGIRTQHRFLASVLVARAFDREELAETIKSMVIVLSDLVTPGAISDRTRAFRTVQVLMSAKTLESWLGVASARKLYAEIEEYFDWNAR